MTEFIPLRMKYTDSGLASGIQELSPGETIDVGYFVASVSSLHSSLSALDADDHPQYLLSATYALSSGSFQSSYETVLNNSGSWGGGSTDHGTLIGLTDDDHPQYVLSATNNTLSSNVSNHIASASVHQVQDYCFAYTSAVHAPVGTGWEQVSGFSSDFVEGYGSPGWALTDTSTIRLPSAGTWEISAKVIVDKSDNGVGKVSIRLTQFIVSHIFIANTAGRGAIKGSSEGGASTFVIWKTTDGTPDIGVQLSMSDTTVTAPVNGVHIMFKKLSDETS